jgi:26S proteasome regulatory subunit N13
MFPADGSFTPYKEVSAQNLNPANKATDGRIYLLRFASSSQRHLFWLQSGSQHPQKDNSWFSARDLKLGQIVNTLLQGDEVDVTEEMNSLPNGHQGSGGDDDESMEDVEGTNHDIDHHRGGSGGAGPGATGGDIREEGEQSREGGADGGRA